MANEGFKLSKGSSSPVSTGAFFKSRDEYRKHPILNGHLKRATPGLGIALGLFGVFLVVDGISSRFSKKDHHWGNKKINGPSHTFYIQHNFLRVSVDNDSRRDLNLDRLVKICGVIPNKISPQGYLILLPILLFRAVVRVADDLKLKNLQTWLAVFHGDCIFRNGGNWKRAFDKFPCFEAIFGLKIRYWSWRKRTFSFASFVWYTEPNSLLTDFSLLFNAMKVSCMLRQYSWLC